MKWIIEKEWADGTFQCPVAYLYCLLFEIYVKQKQNK